MRILRQIICVGLSPLMLVAGTLPGCSSWHSRPLAPADFTESAHPLEVRVSLVGGERFLLRSPVLSGDSLIGMRPREGAAHGQLERVALSIDQIHVVAVKETDAVKTTLLVVGIGVAALLVIAAATFEMGPIYDENSCDAASSCPLVYSWDGKSWRLDSGTFGGAILRALARTDVDNLDFATSKNGVLRLKLANELRETDFVDALEVLAADHDPGVTVAPDGDGKLYTLGHPLPPTRASDFRGRDELARIRLCDGWSWESNPTRRDPAVTADVRDGLELTFARPRGARAARLVIDGNNTVWAAQLLERFVQAHGRTTSAWYDSLEAMPERARELGATLAREAFLTVKVRTPEGWEPRGMFWEAGPEIAKRQVIALDLSNIEGDTVRVRLESVPCFWQLDRVALDWSPERPVVVTTLRVDRAIDRDGRNVRPFLTDIDGRALRMEPGDSAELTFRTPAVPRGLSRSYLVRSHGWYRIHTLDAGEPDLALLESVQGPPDAVSRTAVTHANQVLRRMAAAHR